MQKLSGKLKNTPRNTSLVPCSVRGQLNRDQSLSVDHKVLTDNNSEVNLPQHTEGQILSVIVYVLSVEGKPLMPTTPRKARVLIKEGKAKVIKRMPFTIQLNYKTTNFVQEITLGVDTGYEFIGFSAVTDKKEVLSYEVKLDGKTKKRLITKAMYRRGRRSRHHWYREPRFNNRGIKKGWLAPSVKRRYDTHINIINRIKKILPITKVIIEVANFDIQKLEDPDIQGKEYQQGNLYNYRNRKSYIIARENGKCQICKKEKGNDKWIPHHIIQKKDGGSDKPSNLSLLHLKCHIDLHKKGSKLKVAKNKEYKSSTFMNIVKDKFQKDINCEVTYGYITYFKKCELKLEKSHINDAFVISGGDAFVISGGNNQIRCKTINIIQKHRNNRILQHQHKGFFPAVRKKRYKIQPGDLVKINGKIYTARGIHGRGSQILIGKKSYNTKILDSWTFHYGSFIVEI